MVCVCLVLLVRLCVRNTHRLHLVLPVVSRFLRDMLAFSKGFLNFF